MLSNASCVQVTLCHYVQPPSYPQNPNKLSPPPLSQDMTSGPCAFFPGEFAVFEGLGSFTASRFPALLSALPLHCCLPFFESTRLSHAPFLASFRLSRAPGLPCTAVWSGYGARAKGAGSETPSKGGWRLGRLCWCGWLQPREGVLFLPRGDGLLCLSQRHCLCTRGPGGPQ